MGQRSICVPPLPSRGRNAWSCPLWGRFPGRQWVKTSGSPSLTLMASVRACLLSRFSCVWLCNPMDCRPLGSSVLGDSLGKNTGVGCYAVLQIFPTQEQNLCLPCLLHCRLILYHWATGEAQWHPVKNPNFLKMYYLFIFDRTSLLQGFSPGAVSGDYSSSRSVGFSLRWLSYCGAWTLGYRGFSRKAQAQQLWWTGACGIFLDQGSNPCLLHWQAYSLSLTHQESPQNPNFLITRLVSSSITCSNWQTS